MDIELSNWEANDFYKETKEKSIRLGPCMYLIDKLFLDDSMRLETNSERVKQKIIDLCKK